MKDFESSNCLKTGAITFKSVLDKGYGLSSRNVLLTDYRGNCIDFETTSMEIGEIDATGKGAFVHANHFLNYHMMKYEKAHGNSWVDSHWRQYRFNLLMEQYKGRINGDTLKEILRDHEKDPVYGQISLCTHTCEASNLYHTFSSMIYHLSDGYIEATKGVPCENPYKKYTF